MNDLPAWFGEELARLGDASGAISALEIAMTLGLSMASSMAIATLYRATHRGVSYSQAYAQTLVILGVCVALVMMVIGSNIARAFSLVGALSIVRFRTAVKETKDLAFVFVVMAIGMACGTRFYLIAVAGTLVVSALIFALARFDLFAKEDRERVLRVRLPSDLAPGVLTPAFTETLRDQRLIAMESVSGGALQELVYGVLLRPGVDPAELIERLSKINNGNKVSLVVGQQEVDL